MTINKAQSHKNTPPHNIMKLPNYSVILLPIHIKKLSVGEISVYIQALKNLEDIIRKC